MIGKSSCKTCNKWKDIELWDYSGMRCKHNKQEGFACLAFAESDNCIIHVVGIEENSGMCEMYLPKEESSCSEIPNNSDTISRQAAIDAIDHVDWYHPGSNGRMVHGASDQGDAWFKANDIYDVIEGMPSAELVNTCDGCIHSGKIDKDYPCRVCIRREKDYYAPER